MVSRPSAGMGGCSGWTARRSFIRSQIAPANAVFAPSPDEVAWARRIIAAFEEPQHQGKGVINIDGQMVELLHAEIAKRTVAIADAIGI